MNVTSRRYQNGFEISISGSWRHEESSQDAGADVYHTETLLCEIEDLKEEDDQQKLGEYTHKVIEKFEKNFEDKKNEFIAERKRKEDRATWMR